MGAEDLENLARSVLVRRAAGPGQVEREEEYSSRGHSRYSGL